MTANNDFKILFSTDIVYKTEIYYCYFVVIFKCVLEIIIILGFHYSYQNIVHNLNLVIIIETDK